MKGITLVSDLFHFLTFSKLSFSCFRSLSSSSMWSTLLSSLFFACFSSLRVFFSFSVSSVLSTIKRDRGVSITNHLPDCRPIRLAGTYKFHNQTSYPKLRNTEEFSTILLQLMFPQKHHQFFHLKKVVYSYKRLLLLQISNCHHCFSLGYLTHMQFPDWFQRHQFCLALLKRNYLSHVSRICINVTNGQTGRG